jgi:hypothetical protein
MVKKLEASWLYPMWMHCVAESFMWWDILKLTRYICCTYRKCYVFVSFCWWDATGRYFVNETAYGRDHFVESRFVVQQFFVANIKFWGLMKAYKKSNGYFIGLQHKSKLKVMHKFQPNQLQKNMDRILCLGRNSVRGTVKKKVRDFPLLSRDVTNKTLPGLE